MSKSRPGLLTPGLSAAAMQSGLAFVESMTLEVYPALFMRGGAPTAHEFLPDKSLLALPDKHQREKAELPRPFSVG